MKNEEQARSLFGISLSDRPKWQQFLICSSGFFFGYLVNGVCEVDNHIFFWNSNFLIFPAQIFQKKRLTLIFVFLNFKLRTTFFFLNFKLRSTFSPSIVRSKQLIFQKTGSFSPIFSSMIFLPFAFLCFWIFHWGLGLQYYICSVFSPEG